jgi:hypothetical protein
MERGVESGKIRNLLQLFDLRLKSGDPDHSPRLVNVLMKAGFFGTAGWWAFV